MIFIRKFERLDPKETFVLTDFDRTLTEHDSSTCWGLLEESPYVDQGYAKESLDIYHYYRPIEVDQTIPFADKSAIMEKWFREVALLLSKYHIYEETIEKIFTNSNGLKLRRDVKPFLGRMNELGIPVVIVSAGIGNFIEKYLASEGCLFDNVTIHSNYLIYEGGRIVGVKEPILHSLNKSMLTYPEIGSKRKGLLFGDQIEDKEMGKHVDTISVGFCDTNMHSLKEFKREFDVVLTGDSSYEQVAKTYIKRYKK